MSYLASADHNSGLVPFLQEDLPADLVSYAPSFVIDGIAVFASPYAGGCKSVAFFGDVTKAAFVSEEQAGISDGYKLAEKLALAALATTAKNAGGNAVVCYVQSVDPHAKRDGRFGVRVTVEGTMTKLEPISPHGRLQW